MRESINNPLVSFHAISTPTTGTGSHLIGYYYARVPVAYIALVITYKSFIKRKP